MPTLKELSLALGLLTSDPNPTALVDGWVDYVWRVRDVQHCVLDEGGWCRIVSDRWDWKRPEFYDAVFRLDLAANTITTRVTLRNEDTGDADQVCIVVSYMDANDEMIGIFYSNWQSLPGRNYTREAPITPFRSLADVAKVAIGSKQCDVHATADARNFYRIRQQLKQR